MTPHPLSPEDDHRRRLKQFARWLVATIDSETHREPIIYLARTLDMGGLSTAETLASLDALDGLLSEVWDRRPKEEE